MIHYKKFLIVKQTLLLATMGNVQRTKCRLCTLIPGRKELMLLPVKRKFKFSQEFYLFFVRFLVYYRIINEVFLHISFRFVSIPLQELIIFPSLSKKIGLHFELLTHIAVGSVTHLDTLQGW